MTVVDTDTGEIVDVLSEEQARRIVARINGTAAELIELVEQAWTGRAWVALGYASWDELCKHEIEMPRLDRERRRELVGSLRQIGMSTRAIGSATGVDHSTVSRDTAGGANATPEPAPAPEPKPVTGTDGKRYPAPKPPSEDEQREQDLADGDRRARGRLIQLVTGWIQLVGLSTDSRRAQILRGMTDDDRKKVLEIEAIYERGKRA